MYHKKEKTSSHVELRLTLFDSGVYYKGNKGDEMKIRYSTFAARLRKNGINPDSMETYWKDQLHCWNCGIRDARMHDNALSTLAEIEAERGAQ
jgi:hypothetical protein